MLKCSEYWNYVCLHKSNSFTNTCAFFLKVRIRGLRSRWLESSRSFAKNFYFAAYTPTQDQSFELLNFIINELYNLFQKQKPNLTIHSIKHVIPWINIVYLFNFTLNTTKTWSVLNSAPLAIIGGKWNLPQFYSHYLREALGDKT